MKVVLCANAFKECLTARQVCESLQRGVLTAWASCKDAGKLRSHWGDLATIVAPLADGGDSSLEVLTDRDGGVVVDVPEEAGLVNAAGRPTRAQYGVVSDVLVIEMALVNGLAMLPEAERDPLAASTRGTGQLLLHALENERAKNTTIRKVILCIGGSATNDAGIGMAAALGYQFYDRKGREIVHPTGASLAQIASIRSENVRKELLFRVEPAAGAARREYTVACDVTNPLLGARGAARTFAAQKCAENVRSDGRALESVLASLEAGAAAALPVLRSTFPDVADALDAAGSGAAGGLGAGCIAFLNAKMQSGFEACAEAAQLEAHLRGADLAITGEGRFDSQSEGGKVPSAVARLCSDAGTPVVVVAGEVSRGVRSTAAAFSLTNGPMTLEEAMRQDNAQALLEHTAKNAFALYLSARAKEASSA